MPKHNGPDLKRYMEKRLRIKLNGKRQVSGVLRGYDQFMNLVLDESTEELAGDEKNEIGMVVRRAAACCGVQRCAWRTGGGCRCVVAAAWCSFPVHLPRGCRGSALRPLRRAQPWFVLVWALSAAGNGQPGSDVRIAGAACMFTGGPRQQCYPDGVLGPVVRPQPDRSSTRACTVQALLLATACT